VAWLSLFAEAGTFGEIDRVFSQREMRAADQAAKSARGSVELDVSPAVRAKVADAAFGVRLASDAPGNLGRVPYPDLVLSFRRAGSPLNCSSPRSAAIRSTGSSPHMRGSRASPSSCSSRTARRWVSPSKPRPLDWDLPARSTSSQLNLATHLAESPQGSPAPQSDAAIVNDDDILQVCTLAQTADFSLCLIRSSAGGAGTRSRTVRASPRCFAK
jgi:hypothetical protein